MEADWILLSDCRNPALSLALAVSEGRRVEWSPSRRSCGWYPATPENVADILRDGNAWHLTRIERQPEPEEPGPCPVCGGRSDAISWNGDRVWYVECLGDCGVSGSESATEQDAVKSWNRLRVVD